MEELLRVERDGASNSSSSQARHGEASNRVRMNLLTQRTQRSERTKEFLFMGKIVTGGVGQMRTYGPRGQGGGRLGIKGLGG